MNDAAIPAAGETETATDTAAREPVLRIVNGSKVYGGVHAIESVDFDLYPGEVHALVGENGAGNACGRMPPSVSLLDYFVDGKPSISSAAMRLGRHLHGVSGDQPGSDDDRGAEHRARQ